MSDLDAPGPINQPIRLRDPGPSGSRTRGSSESLAPWGAAILVGLSVMGYVLIRATRDATEPAPAPVVTAQPAPAPRPVTPRRTIKSAPAPVVVHHVEPEKKVVDPIKGFESGEAFDNPPSPGRYGMRPRGRPDRDESNNTAPARPNVPDPSFGRTPR